MLHIDRKKENMYLDEITKYYQKVQSTHNTKNHCKIQVLQKPCGWIKKKSTDISVENYSEKIPALEIPNSQSNA